MSSEIARPGVMITRPAPAAMPDVRPRRPGRPPTRPDVGRCFVWLVLPLAAFAVKAAGFGRWIVDDAAISFAYARSIAEGHGVVQQPGARVVEAYSNPLWTGLLALLRLAGVFDNGHVVAGMPDYVLVPKVLALVCTAGVLVCYRVMIGAILPRWPAVVATGLAGLCLAMNPSYVGWVVSGLENPLYALLAAMLAAVLARAIARDRLVAPGVATAASAIALCAAATRPDGVIYAAAYPLVVLAMARRSGPSRLLRPLAVSMTAFCVPAAALLLLRLHTFGLLVPNTAVAKGQAGPDLAGLGKVFQLAAYVGWPVVVVSAGIVVLACLDRDRGSRGSDRAADWPGDRIRAGFLGPATVLALALVAFSVQNRGSFSDYRFATPVWVAASAVFAVALVHVLASPRSRTPISSRSTVRTVVAVAVVVALGLSYVDLRTATQRFHARPSVPLCFVVERSREYNELADRLGVRVGSIVLPDIGGTLLTSKLTVYDLAGLSDRTIANDLARGDLRAVADYVFDTVRPTFIHVHGGWRRLLVTDPRLLADYVALVPNQDYVRRDVVRAPSDHAAARRFMAEATRRLNSWAMGHLRASCGPSLAVGSPSAIPR